jgi:hypothetical protein
MSYLLEINDCALSLYSGAEVHYQAPAIAIVQAEAISFGEPALRQMRIHPRQANQQYVARLNADPLPYPVAQASNHADLVYLHLQEFMSRVRDAGEDLILAVPGILSNDQLGVLLGIIQETGVTVSGFVDAATAATSDAPISGTTHHIDMHLQRACITTLAAGGQIERQRAEEVTEAGLSNLLDSWVNVIADRFVRDTRFDPLHAAATEQQLYNQVYDWVQGPGSATAQSPASEIGIDIEYQDYARHVDIPRSLLEDKAQQRVQRLVDALPTGAHVTLSAHCARLPGVSKGLRQAGHDVSILEANALAVACERQMGAIRSPEGRLRLVSALPSARKVNSPQAPAPSTDVAEGAVPTHLLDSASAVAMPVDALAPSLSLAVSSSAGGVYLTDIDSDVLLNGEPVSGRTELCSGDEISKGEARYLLITVEP